jgi:hypothetical protein
MTQQRNVASTTVQLTLVVSGTKFPRLQESQANFLNDGFSDPQSVVLQGLSISTETPTKLVRGLTDDIKDVASIMHPCAALATFGFQLADSLTFGC